MRVAGLEQAHTPITHGVFAVRFAKALSPTEQEDVRRKLTEAGAAIEEPDEGEERSPSRFVAGIWNPPTASHLGAARAAVERLETEWGAEAAWFFQVGTEVDAVAAAAESDEDENENDDEEGEGEGEGEEDENDEGESEGEEDENENDEDEDEDEDGTETNHWQSGPPPRAESVPFPLEGYPVILETFDWEDFGLAFKLGGESLEGEENVLAAMHEFWLRPYIDRRLADEEGGAPLPFRHARVARDPKHRSALFWVDRFTPPATVDQMVHHLVWVALQLHQILPIEHARFGQASIRMKYGAVTGDESFLVLAGNPLATRFDDEGEESAVAWAETQRQWAPAEVAAMYLELGMRNDPDDPDEAALALRMFDRAFSRDQECGDARIFAIQVLIAGDRIAEALARAEKSGEPTVRAQTLGLVAEKRPEAVGAVRTLIEPSAIAQLSPEALGEVLVAVAAHAPGALADVLAAIPDDPKLVPCVFNASFQMQDQNVQLRALDRVLSMPEPAAGREREEYMKAYNNACVLANTLKDFPRAVAIADRAQRFAAEDPFIYHAAACAYASVGEEVRAFDQVKKAVLANYDHLDQVETDPDLGNLRETPAFKALFVEWKANREKSEPLVHATDDTFERLALAHDRPVLVDFSASWCAPCKALAPIVEKLALQSMGRYRVVAIDVDESPSAAKRFGIKSFPTVVIVEGGRERARHVGLTDKATLTKLLQPVERSG
jgi:thioredoxin 1